MESRRQSRHRQLYTPCEGSACYLIWSAPTKSNIIPARTDSWVVQIACRLIVPQPLAKATKEKISMFCHVASEQVVGVHDVTSVYHVPLLLQSQGIVSFLKRRLNLPSLNLTSEMLEHGTTLERRWKTITIEWVLSHESGGTHDRLLLQPRASL